MTDPGNSEPIDNHDDAHLLSPEEWALVVSEAEGRVPRTLAKLGSSSFPSVTGFIRAKYDGGPQPEGRPFFGVLHDAETPLANGYALSISNYFTRNTNETSAHFMLGPDATYQLLDTSLIGWHCGNGNTRSIGVEQAGYASFTPDQWETAAGQAQMVRLAQLMKEIQAAHGIGLYWMSDQQILDAWNGKAVGGWTTHYEVARVVGGSSHTDPMPNYPLQALMTLANGGSPAPAPVPPPPPPHPPVLSWPLAPGNYVGAKTGPAQCHGGDPRYDSPQVCALVENVLRWFIYHGCVPGVPASAWSYSNWAKGGWDAQYGDPVAATWHARFYPNQPKPAQIWSDDYARLARP